MGRFIEVLRELHEKKNIKIKINDHIEQIIKDASVAAE
jgi:hypothetical protein